MTEYRFQVMLRDERGGIDYVVHSHRELSNAEALQVVRVFRASARGRKVRRGRRYDIVTEIGSE